jgi:hypothetical protein
VSASARASASTAAPDGTGLDGRCSSLCRTARSPYHLSLARSILAEYNRYRQNAAGGAGARGWEDNKAANRTPGQGSRFNKRYNRLADARWQSTRQNGPRTIREPSVKIAGDWLPLESFELSQLTKLNTSVPAASDLRWAGSLEQYDEDYDRVTAKLPRKLRVADHKHWAFVGSGEDPVIEELAQEDAGNVYATDAVLAHLMCCHKSVYPWDIVITVLPGGVIFLDAREQLDFELHSVNETAHAMPDESNPEALNGRQQLTFESSAIHQNFTQQVRFNTCLTRFQRFQSPVHSIGVACIRRALVKTQ